MTRLLPELFARPPRAAGRPLPARCCSTRCARSRRAGDGDPTVVVWTPGPLNSAYFEHAFLARQMGVELVEASDLVVRDERVLHAHDERARSACTRSTAGSTTTSSTRSSSGPTPCSACPGLMRAYRAGTVAIANAVGTGVADDKAIYHYVPEMIRYYLGEEPILDNVPTYMLDDREQRAHVLVAALRAGGQADERVGRQGRLHRADGERRRRSSASGALVEAQPARWIAQELVQLSTCPTAIGGRPARAAPRRPAAVRGVRRRHPHRPRRAHARRAARGLDDRQLLAGRRLEGHVGARGRPRRRPRPGSTPARRGRRRRCRTCSGAAAGPRSSRSSSSNRACSPGSPTSCTGSAAPRARGAHRADARRRSSTRTSQGRARASRARERAADVGQPRCSVIMGLELGAPRPTATRSCAG